MKNDPILVSREFAPGEFEGEDVRMTVKVYGGLHYLKGNRAPYFSLTYWAHQKGRKNSRECGGAGHKTILRYWPEFADLAALHLSDIDGVPMHAGGNGWYYLAGTFPDAYGEKYHGGNSDQHFPLPPDSIDPAKPWQTTEYRKPTGDECLQIFADYIRVSREEAAAIRAEVDRAAKAAPHSRNKVAREALKPFIEALKPRWKAEADACIAKHGLVVYGDKWER